VPDAPFKIERLKKRPDFLACAQAAHCARGAVLVQARPRDAEPLVRAGFTATKRIGGGPSSATAPSAACARPRGSCCRRSPPQVSTMCSSPAAV